MRCRTNILFAGLATVSLSLAQNSTVRCAPGLKMFVSRGTGEDMGLGVTEALVEVIASQINGSDYEAIEYPASFDNPSYFVSVSNGTGLVRSALTEYVEACPDSKIALFGYSQGAQITSNSLCGMPPIWALQLGTASDSEDLETILQNAIPLPETATKNIVSVVLFGDPTHRNESSYNHGNATGNGIFYRAASPSCEKLGHRIRSYCDAGDPFCDVEAPPSVTAHGSYIQSHGEDAALFVVEQYKNGGQSGNSDNSSNSGPTTTSSPSSVPTNAANVLTPMSLFAVVASVVVLGMI